MGTWPCGPRSRITVLVVLTVPVLAELLSGQARTQPRQVNGVLGGSVLLSPALPPNRTVKEIEWSFSAGTGATIQVAELGPGGFERSDPKDRFKDRLEMFNQTGLRIAALQRGDSGIYGARIKLHPAIVEDQFFNLSIYEPVPVPEIQRQQLSISTHGCNLTLRCWVPAGSGAEVSWQLSSAMGPAWGWLCGGSHMLCLALPSSAFNSSYSCVARNPIEERSISIHMDTLCRPQGAWWWWKWLIAVVGIMGILLGIAWLWRKRRKRRKREAVRGAALVPISSEDAPPEPSYAKIQRTKPLQWHHEHPITIYSEVRAGGRAATAQHGR
ncbi:signaling lymphocytic activation molecule-like isoform X2 [Lathamus discolor]|uniref:signaling lymphocytic activation molecule-like isoform X2 n=1 Tax=Lathamus discolor TaxID=678569 RepID=UPI0032B7D92F